MYKIFSRPSKDRRERRDPHEPRRPAWLYREGTIVVDRKDPIYAYRVSTYYTGGTDGYEAKYWDREYNFNGNKHRASS